MENIKNIAMRIRYDGTNYHGWQSQSNGVTVQSTIEKALSELTGSDVKVTGCSRTDAGVHALDYIFNFKSETKIPVEKLPYALNYRLEDDITALEAWVAADDFNSRFSVNGKRYIYNIWNSALKNPFLNRYSWHFPYKLDFKKIKAAAVFFEGKHDFAGFMVAGGQQKTTVRTISVCGAEQSGEFPELLTITVEADAFLYNMVRIIVGTLADVGTGRIEVSDIPEIICSKDRRQGGITAPPQGLFLKKVYL